MNDDNKYIYELEEGKYRIRIIRQATNDAPALRFSETVNGTFEQAKKIRDAKLKGIPLNKPLLSSELEYKKEKKTKKTIRTKNIEKNDDLKRIDKYIYEVGPNKYRILIKKGSKKIKCTHKNGLEKLMQLGLFQNLEDMMAEHLLILISHLNLLVG